MSPRKTAPGAAMTESEMEEDDLGTAAPEHAPRVDPPANPGPTPSATPAARDAGGDGVPPRAAPSVAGIGGFAVGAILMLAAAVLLLVALNGVYYEVQFREGPAPDGEDTSDTQRYTIRLADWDAREVEPEGDVTVLLTEQSYNDAPFVKVALALLTPTAYIGAGLVILAFLAALLHRFGALTVAGPAPVLGVFGVITLVMGLVPFMRDIAHHARLQWVPGLLDPHPAFFTIGSGGTRVHALNMLPGAGFWLHVAGTAAAAVGLVFLFWSEFARAARSVKAFAEEAAVP